MVAVVAQNTRLKKKVDQSYVAKLLNMSRLGMPTSPKSASSPIKSPAPSSTNTMVPRQKSSRFFMMMLPACFARVKPVSTMANPACMNQTRMAPIKNQTPVDPKMSITLPPKKLILSFYPDQLTLKRRSP